MDEEQSYTLSIAEDESLAVADGGKKVLAVDGANISSIINEVVNLSDGLLIKDQTQDNLKFSYSDGKVSSEINNEIAEQILKGPPVEGRNLHVVEKDKCSSKLLKSEDNSLSIYQSNSEGHSYMLDQSTTNKDLNDKILCKGSYNQSSLLIDNNDHLLKSRVEESELKSETIPAETMYEDSNICFDIKKLEKSSTTISSSKITDDKNLLEDKDPVSVKECEEIVQNLDEELHQEYKIKDCYNTNKQEKKAFLEMEVNKKTFGTSEVKDEVFVNENTIDRACDEDVTWDNENIPFSWVKYMNFLIRKDPKNNVTTPLSIFSSLFPIKNNLFKCGMKLEALDPQHQSLFCVVTVVDTMGHRIKLHFDGFSDIYDFWINADSFNIFPAGWCTENSIKLQAPPGTTRFNWDGYLTHCRSIAAPRNLFHNTCSSFSNHHFSIGMKLEVEDLKCHCFRVATIKNVIGSRIMVHFDGMNAAHDYWCGIFDPHIRPLGWCYRNGVKLVPPKQYNSKTFNWHQYLNETSGTAAPVRAFRTRSPKPFSKDMRIEVVDKWNPMLIRVASIVDILAFNVKIHFDGWHSMYDFWLRDDSPDIFPPTYCVRTGHPLQPPLTTSVTSIESRTAMKGCNVIGCKGYGHVRGSLYTTHHTPYGCPYSLQNLNRDPLYFVAVRITSDNLRRLKKSAIKSNPLDFGVGLSEDEDGFKKRVRKRRRFFDEITAGNQKGKILRLDDNIYPSGNDVIEKGNSEHKEGSVSIDVQVHQSVFHSKAEIYPQTPIMRSKSFKSLLQPFDNLDRKTVEGWTVDEVNKNLLELFGIENDSLAGNFIDGEALMLLTFDDLVSFLQLELGDALKLTAFINFLHNKR